MSLRFALRLSEVLFGTTLLTVGVLGALPEDTDGAGGTSRSFLGFFHFPDLLIEKSWDVPLT